MFDAVQYERLDREEFRCENSGDYSFTACIRVRKETISFCIANIIIEIITRTVSVGDLAAECLGTHGQTRVFPSVITQNLSSIKLISTIGPGEFLLIY